MNMLHNTILSPRRQRRRETRLNQILETAQRIAVAEGLENLTMPHLAQTLDCAVGALYRYFPSKAALIAGLQVAILESFGHTLADRDTALEARLKHPKITPQQVILARIWDRGQAWLDLLQAQPAEFQLLSLTISDPRIL